MKANHWNVKGNPRGRGSYRFLPYYFYEQYTSAKTFVAILTSLALLVPALLIRGTQRSTSPAVPTLHCDNSCISSSIGSKATAAWPTNTSSMCSPKLQLDCTDWVPANLDMELMEFRAQFVSENEHGTQVKLCKLKNEESYLPVDSWVRSAGMAFPSGIALLDCTGAVLSVSEHYPNIKEGTNAKLLCGQPRPAGGGAEDVDILMAADLRFPGIQHTVQNGLGFAGAMWNFLKDDNPDLHILVGDPFKDLHIDLVGKDRVIVAGEDTLERKWFRRVYFGFVPTKMTPNSELSSGVQKTLDRIIYGGVDTKAAMLPCSVYSMPGFQKWRADFSLRPLNLEDELSQSTAGTDNNLLLYLQRTGRRFSRYWDCGSRDRPHENSNTTCSCQSVLESEFIERLGTLGQRHGLEIKVFDHTNLKEDANTFARARVVLGPHGGAFTNMVFLDPGLKPIIIETNLQQAIFNCCNSSKISKGIEEPRHFFAHLAASLGHRYTTYQPHVWRGYDGDYMNGDNTQSVEVNDYLDFVEKAISDEATSSFEQISAPRHPCVPFMK